MYPTLLHLGRFTLNSYGMLAALAMIAAGLVVQRLAHKLGTESGVALELTLAAVVGGLVGARLYWAAEHWQDVLLAPFHALSGGAGFTWYGGLLGGFVAVLLVAKWRHVSAGTVANIMAPSIALGYAVARIGCFLAGDGTYGRPSGLPWAMAFPHGKVPTTVPVQPTTLYETAAMFVVFVILYRSGVRRVGTCSAGSSCSPAQRGSWSSSCASTRGGSSALRRRSGSRSRGRSSARRSLWGSAPVLIESWP